jgi:hypothetical protein
MEYYFQPQNHRRMNINQHKELPYKTYRTLTHAIRTFKILCHVCVDVCLE